MVNPNQTYNNDNISLFSESANSGTTDGEFNETTFDPDPDGGATLGTNLDLATQEFLDETRNARILVMKPNKNTGDYHLTVLDFCEYLGINLELEPELSWVAREMLCAPMPPNAEMLCSKGSVVYFHDLENDYYTLEHPLTSRYLKILERSRIDILAFRTKPTLNGLILKQPDILFHQSFRNLQLPCQDCGVVQSHVRCEQCLQSYCQGCFDNIHKFAVGPKCDHTVTYTGCGSFCSTCSVKKPQVYCGNCEDYFCFACFQSMHQKGFRSDHRAQMISGSDGEICELGNAQTVGNFLVEKRPKNKDSTDPTENPHPALLCEECEDANASFYCDSCRDRFCAPCFWKCHFNGNRRTHTVTKTSITPLCGQCANVRATVFDEQEQELLCTDCFTFLHCKGNRMLHIFTDAMNLMLLLERLDPVNQEHLRRARPRVMWAITKLQAWCRGAECRRVLRQRRDFVTKIQSRWRGAKTRAKLLSMMDSYKWRRKQIHNYFMPKSRPERLAARHKFKVAMNQRSTSQRAAKETVNKLKSTILSTVGADPFEDRALTLDQVQRAGEPDNPYKAGGGGVNNSTKQMLTLLESKDMREGQSIIELDKVNAGGKVLNKMNSIDITLPVFSPYKQLSPNKSLSDVKEPMTDTIKGAHYNKGMSSQFGTTDDLAARRSLNLLQKKIVATEDRKIGYASEMDLRQLTRIDERVSDWN